MRARESRSVWQERVQRWQASGLGAKEFARRERVNPNTLAFWKWKLGVSGRSSTTSARRSSPANALSFVELVAGVTGRGTADEESWSDGVELLAPGGYRIRVGPNFSSEALGAVLDVIGGRS